VALAIIGGLGVFIYLWSQTGATALAPSVAVQRFRQIERGGVRTVGPGPAQGVYLYRGSGTETVSVPPKSQSEGPEIPGTVIDRPGGCFEFRLDYSDVHWQDWTYCLHGGSMVTTSKAGYYLWDFVVFSVDDTSTYTCSPAIVTVPGDSVVHSPHRVSCIGTNDHISTGLVHMDGTSMVTAAKTLRVGSAKEPAVLVREDVALSGGQHGSNHADTWFSVTTGLPLRGTWSTVVSTPSPIGTSTLRAHGRFDLTSLAPQH
jgi:hypothetical protein